MGITFIYFLVYSFNKHLGAYYVPDTVLGIGDTAVKKREIICLHEAYILGWGDR